MHLSREQVAEIEIGHTDLTQCQKRVLVLGFLLVLAMVPLAHHVAAFTTRGGEGSRTGWPILLEAAHESLATFRVGPKDAEPDSDVSMLRHLIQANRVLLGGMNRFESQLEEHSQLQALLLPPTQALFTGLLGTGNEEVYTGLQNWLFYRPGIDHLTGPGFLAPKQLQARRQSGNEWEPPPQPDPVLAILDFSVQLAERGIELVVVPVPAKASIHPERFAARYRATTTPVHNLSYGQFLEELRTPGLFFENRFEGYREIMRNPANRAMYETALERLAASRGVLESECVTVFDPTELLARRKLETGEPQFVSTDTHWTSRTMEFVADGLATFVRNRIGLPGRPTPETVVITATATQPGDLVAMLKLPPSSTHFPPVTQPLRVVTSHRKHWAPDPEADILLLGDSFSNIYSDPSLKWGESAGFAEHLSRALGRPVDAIRQNGGGASAARAELANELRRGRDRLAGRKLVIWQFAARELSVGNWRLLPMTLAQRTQKTQTPTGATHQVSGTVKSMAALPRPGSTPYKDHIIWLHLTDITGDAPFPGPSALVYMRSMRNRKLTEIATLRRGRRARFRLQPWDDVKQRYGRIRREEPTDDNLILEEPFWGELDGSAAPRLEKNKRESSQSGTAPGTASTAQLFAAKLAVGGASVAAGLPPNLLRQIRGNFKQLAESADGRMTVRGRDGWFFHSAELRQMALERFWGKAALDIQPARKEKHADPLTAIVAYHEECSRHGIELILLPIPGKSVIYPEQLLDPELCKAAELRIDAAHQAFYSELRNAGVNVLDLVPLLLKHRADPAGPVYCRQDTHYSPRACVLIAGWVAEHLKSKDWFGALNRQSYQTRAETITITGDLCREMGEGAPPKEELAIRRVGQGDDLTPVEPDESSPVLLLSDSHGLVFHAGNEMHARGAGLPDQLAKELGFAVDLLAVMGSAARPARVSLFRRIRRDPAYLEHKRVIIWCFTMREFTNSSWGVIPLKK